MKIKITLEEFGGSFGPSPKSLIAESVAQNIALTTRAVVHGVLGEVDVEVYWRDELMTTISRNEFNNMIFSGSFQPSDSEVKST